MALSSRISSQIFISVVHLYEFVLHILVLVIKLLHRVYQGAKLDRKFLLLECDLIELEYRVSVVLVDSHLVFPYEA